MPTRSYGWPQTTVHRWTPLAWSGWTAVRGQSTGCRRRGDLTPPKTATASGTGASNAVEFVDAVEQISRADRAHRKTPRLRLLSSTGRFGSVADACVVSMNCPARVEPGDGQESVWDHPWSPRIEPACRQLRVCLARSRSRTPCRGCESSKPVIRRTTSSRRPTSPPTRSSATMGRVGASGRGRRATPRPEAQIGSSRTPRGATRHRIPTYGELAGMVAFYPALMDACFVDDERARAAGRVLRRLDYQ